jgi:ankyrin repeat protein
VNGTCQWVLSHSQYLQWYTHTHDDLLWISADPGCGKSVFAKSLVENELRTTDEHTVCYFFFKDNEQQDGLTTALCALLHQLFSRQPQLIHHAIPAWDKTGDKVTKEVAELWRILLAAARDDQVHDVTCVLDALDECRLSDRRVLIDMLAGFYTQTSRSPSGTRRGRLKFLITSRPYDDIQFEFQKTLDNLPTIRLRGEEENDAIHQEIDLVIRMRVAQLATNLKLDGQTKDRLETRLLEMEHRTYLWLYLAIEGIHETYRRSVRPKETVIDSLPLTVKDAYEKILSRVPQKYADTVKSIFRIVVGARRPLSIQEMAIALGIATSVASTSLAQAQLDPQWIERSIRYWCGLFVFINHDRIYLIHQTAKEFLISGSYSGTSLSGWKHCLDLRGIEREMTRICVEFLCLEDVWPTAQSLIQQFQQFQEYQKVDDFLEKDNHVQSLLAYSAEHWPSHLREACLCQDDSVVSRILPFYQVDSKMYHLWFPIFWRATRSYNTLPEMSGIRLGGLLGHENILELTLEGKEYTDIDESDEEGWTALIWASQCGHETVVEILVDVGADVNAQGGEYGNALCAASDGGHGKIVQMLVEAGADVNAQGGYYGNALQVASSGGHEKVVQMLIDAGADVNAQGGRYGNALQAASEGGHEKIVQMLVDMGADVNAQGGRYGNALQAASDGGHGKIVQILVDARADVNAQGGRYGNALYATSEGGHGKIVQMLIDVGVDVNAQGGRYGNALQAASEGGHEKIVQMLVDVGADVNAQGGEYGNALCAASDGGHGKIVQMLVEAGVDVNAPGGLYGNALWAASASGHKKVVQMLVDAGVDVNGQGGEYGNALQAASEGGHEKIVQTLLDSGADVNAQGGEYGNALCAASDGGHGKIVQMLVEAGADVNAQVGYYGNALQVASARGHEEVVQTLLDSGADVNAQGGEYVNALQAASEGGHGTVVQILRSKILSK